MNTLSIETLILDLLSNNPNATSEDLHQLCKACNINPKEFSVALKRLVRVSQIELTFKKEDL